MDIDCGNESITGDYVRDNEECLRWYFTRIAIEDYNRYHIVFEHNISSWFVRFSFWFFDWCCGDNDIEIVYFPDWEYDSRQDKLKNIIV